jgi:hypothetical protein
MGSGRNRRKEPMARNDLAENCATVALGVTENPGLDCLGVAAAPGYGKSWIAFARQKFTRSGLDEGSNHLN